MNRECPYCKRLFVTDEPPVASWTCFMCENRFPLSVAYVEQELDGKTHTVCNECLEDYLEFLHGEVYLKSRRSTVRKHGG